jgi:hypothetical protein
MTCSAPALDRPGSPLGQGLSVTVVAAVERLARVAALLSDLAPVSTGGEFCDGGYFRVRYV